MLHQHIIVKHLENYVLTQILLLKKVVLCPALLSMYQYQQNANTYPTSTAVFRSSYIFCDRMAFVKANSHGVANSHVCKHKLNLFNIF